MKKLLLIIALATNVLLYSQSKTQYQRLGKLTQTEIDAIDVSNTKYIYTAYNTDTGREEINYGAGWVARNSGVVSGTVDYDDILNKPDFVIVDPDSPVGAPMTFRAGTTEQLNNASGSSTIEFVLDDPGNDVTTDGYVDGISVTGTDTKTITLSRNGMSDITTTFTDQGTGGSSDGNDYLLGVTESSDILTFNVQNQTNPTFDLGDYLDGKGYLTTEVDGSISNELQTISKSGSTVTLSDGGGSFTDSNTQLTQEQVQDYVGPMLTGNTESGITVTYDDAANEIDFTVNFPDGLTTAEEFNVTGGVLEGSDNVAYTSTSKINYYQIGKMVVFDIDINAATGTTPTGSLRFDFSATTLPPIKSTVVTPVIVENIGGTTDFYSVVAESEGGIFFYFYIQDALDSDNHVNLTNVDLSNVYFNFSGSYITY